MTQISDELAKSYEREKDIWGLPQVYRGIQFHPIKVKDVDLKKRMLGLLAIPKNYIKDAKILKLSYLKFIIFVVGYGVRKENLEDEVVSLLKDITRIEDIHFSIEEHPEHPVPEEKIKINIQVGDVLIREREFDLIRELILLQNGTNLEFVESFNPELEEILMGKVHSGLSGEMKDEVFALCSILNKTVYELGDYTIFQYQEHTKRALLLNDYMIYRPLEASGQIKMKQGNAIKHFLSPIADTTRYGSILIDKEKFMKTNDIMKL